MLSKPPMQDSPTVLEDDPCWLDSVGLQIVRRNTIENPLRATLKFSHIEAHYNTSFTPYGMLGLIKHSLVIGSKITIQILVTYEQLLSACKVYILPYDPFITYEPSDIEWLEYFGYINPAIQPLDPTEPIHLKITDRAVQQTFITYHNKPINLCPKTNNAELDLTILSSLT